MLAPEEGIAAACAAAAAGVLAAGTGSAACAETGTAEEAAEAGCAAVVGSESLGEGESSHRSRTVGAADDAEAGVRERPDTIAAAATSTLARLRALWLCLWLPEVATENGCSAVWPWEECAESCAAATGCELAKALSKICLPCFPACDRSVFSFRRISRTSTESLWGTTVPPEAAAASSSLL